MAWLATLLTVVQVLAALGVIILVLIQHGKGADMGAAFGSGTSGSLFGATGSANFLSRSTAALATLFFVATLALAFVGFQRPQAPRSVMEGDVPASAPAKPSDVPDARPSSPGADRQGSEKSPGAGDIPK